jgi:flagellum-specific peptidoglycan hydrolase FlgJ
MSEYATTHFKKKVGTRIQVFEGIALETSGGLRKKDLIISKTGSIVSKKASQSAKDRLASGKGLCEYCIKKYEKSLSEKESSKKSSKKKSSKKKSKKESSKKESSKKKSSKKKSKKKSKKESSKKKSSKKELVLKIKKPKGVTKDKIKELEKEIEKLREKAGRIAEKEGKMTKEVKNILELVTNKVREMIAMKKVLKEKNKESII